MSVLSPLPPPARLREISKAVALLDEILEPEWEFRYFSYDEKWGKSEEVGSMRDGEGNYFFILFSREGTVVRGFDHECALAKLPQEKLLDTLFKGLPPKLAAARREPAFQEATFARWHLVSAKAWTGHPPAREGADGATGLLWMFDGEPKTYVRHAKDYFERRIELADVRQIYAQRVSAEVIARLNPDANVTSVLTTARQLGFAITGGRPPPARNSSRATKQALNDVFYPQLLAKRLRTFVLVDAIVAPTRRTISLRVNGTSLVATVESNNARLHIWLAQKSGVSYGYPTRGAPVDDASKSTMPAALARRWRANAPNADRATFVAWSTDLEWILDRDDERVAMLLQRFRRGYSAWASRHYGHRLHEAAVRALWNGLPLTRALVAALNPKASWANVAREARAIGWKLG